MRSFNLRQEASWILVLAVVLPLLGVFVALVMPSIIRLMR
jgi:hypothetical protein